MFLKLVLSVVLVLVFVWFFVIPIAKAKVIRADRNAVEGFQTSESINTGLIPVGDVATPPGHIALYQNGVMVSTSLLGPNVQRIANAAANGNYVLVVKDETGQTVSVNITTMKSNGSYYVIYNGNIVKPSYKEYKNQDRGGADIACYFDGRSANFCKDACDSNPNCKSYNNIHRRGKQEGCCHKWVSGPIAPFPGGGVDLYVKQSSESTIATKFAKAKKLAIYVGPAQASVNLEQYTAEHHNPLSEAIDSTIPNFAVEPTGIDADPNLTEIEYVNHYTTAANVANQQIQYALANPGGNPELETVPPVNPLIRKAKQCETLKGRASCSNLSDPKYSDCGVCLKAGTQYDGRNPGTYIGGLLSLASERTGGSAIPTVGQCPPGMFYVDAQACQNAAKALNCAEAAPSANRTAEGLKIPIASCPLNDRIPEPQTIGQGLADGNLEAIVGAKAIATAATSSNNYDAWLKMLTTYYNVLTKEGGSYINSLMSSPFGTALQQSGVLTIVGNPSASLVYPAYQTAYQGYMAATTG
jgi:hypothetical protein